jgi:hypothetical protein
MATKLIRNRILEALGDHPLLSRRQLELFLGLPGRSVRQGLQELETRGWVRPYNARQPGLLTRSLFAPTGAGIRELSLAAGNHTAEDVRHPSLAPARLEQLILLMERVFQLRTLFLWLTGNQPISRRPALKAANPSGSATSSRSGTWRPHAWDVEVARFFGIKEKAFWIPFHAAAVMVKQVPATTGHEDAPQNASGIRWVPIVVEFDLRRVPVDRDRDRLVKYVLAQDDPRFWAKEAEGHFPVLAVIARDEFRLQDYYSILRATAVARRLPFPRAYLTTTAAMLTLRQDPLKPIWYSTVSGQHVPLLSDLEGNPGPPPQGVPWRRLPLMSGGSRTGCNDEAELSNHGKLTLEATDGKTSHRAELVSLALALTPLAKKLLDEIAAHPLLSQADLALLLQNSRRKVRLRLGDLGRFRLIECHRERYLLAPRGEEYLTMAAGFAHAVRRHARARGWARGYDSLLRHFEHTRAENDFFLSLAHIAQRRGHSLRWLSELESRLYYEAGHRRHSFLPDGRGVYRAHGRRYEFAVEIDRSRMGREKFRRKFLEYGACVDSNVLRREGIELLRVLVVTGSWERAAHLAQVVWTVASDLTVWFTTFDRLQASGADAPIWLSAKVGAEQGGLTSPKEYCFGCFRPNLTIARQDGAEEGR